jgi:hypothetical protein
VEELDGPPDPGVEQAWLDEAQRRSREIDSGVAKPISAEEVLAKRAELKWRSISEFRVWDRALA